MSNRSITSLGNRSAVRRAVAAALLAVVVIVSSSFPSPALASEGSVTVKAVNGNAANTFKVYQVFTADIDDANTATHVAWNDAVRNTVLAFLDENGYASWLASNNYEGNDARENAQNAAEFIAERISSSPTDEAAGTDPGTKTSGSFSSGLARHLASSGATADTARAGEAYTNAEGYYLIVTDPAAFDTDAAATAPIWLALGGSITEIEEKSALPTIDMKVKGVGDSDWSHATDAFPLQDLDCKIEATMPSNIAAFGTYRFRLTDVMDGMDLSGSDTSSVRVYVGGVDVTSSLDGDVGTLSYANATLCVDFADILSLGGVTVTDSTTVTVEFKAHNMPVQGNSAGSGGRSTASLTYTADPVSGKQASTVTTSRTARAFSYKAHVVKVDKSSKHTLAHAVFAVKVKAYPQDPTLVGKYVQNDGSLADSRCEFESDQDGALTIPGLDAGVYTIEEVSPPQGYELQDSDITLTISPSIDATSAILERLSATVTGGEAISVEGDEHTRVSSTDAATGTVDVLAADDRAFALANTGLEGLSAYAAIAAAMAATGFAGLFAATRRRHNKRGKQEGHGC